MSLRPTSQKNLNTLTPTFRALIQQLVKCGNDGGFDVQISCGYRSPEVQATLYGQGRTKPGKIVTNARPWRSLHQYRIAVDLFFMIDGKADFTPSNYKKLWELACKMGLDKEGLTWSGTWLGKLKETAHFQLGKPKWQDLYAEHLKTI